MKVKKIETTLPLKVQGQACTNNCEEKIWAGKKEADGWEAGCWYTIDLEKQFGITINHSNIKYTSLCSINSIGKLIGGIVDEKTKIDS